MLDPRLGEIKDEMMRSNLPDGNHTALNYPGIKTNAEKEKSVL